MVSAFIRSGAEPGSSRGWVLPSQKLRELVAREAISAEGNVDESQIQPASIDLRLADHAYQVRASFLPGEGRTVADQTDHLLVQRLDLSSGAVLLPGNVYVVAIRERLHLPPNICGKANPRSTTGRLDMLTRLLFDGAMEFDNVPLGYSGPLYAEVIPRTFAVRVRAGQSLGQVRFFSDVEYFRAHSDGELNTLREAEQIAFDETGMRAAGRIQRGLRVRVDLCGQHGHSSIIGYRAKRSAPVLDFGARGTHRCEDYWDILHASRHGELTLEPDDFYILVSCERIRVPSSCAAEMVAYDTAMGEVRVHYAGFFDPGFGVLPDCRVQGTPAVLEVRSHEFPFRLEHGQEIGRVLYESMEDIPDKLYGSSIGSQYQWQTLTLSKQFARSPAESGRTDVGTTAAASRI